MKKYIIMSLAVLLTFSFTSCKEDSGTEPGNDNKAVATIYKYEPKSPYNPDNDVVVRMVGNNKVNEIYYFAETKADFDANMLELGESGYIEYVMANGSKGEIIEDTKSELGVVTVEKVFTNLIGENIISAVSVSASGKSLNTTTFVGLEWEDVTDGYYQFGSGSKLTSVSGLEGVETTLQHCTTAGKENMYRLVNVFGDGYHMKFTIMPETEEETEDGLAWYCRVPIQPTSWSYGQHGTLFVRDIAYWQGSDSFATDADYGCYMYEDGYTFFPLQYSVSAGNVGYTYYGICDTFIPSIYLESREYFARARALK